ncbi:MULTISPECIES: hypothetical protein [unclassified Corallococcus]|uniref:hypothetical protein n=1 Tax=unclassified Corallococcus TaxID=2685029 RepID=UPI001CBF7560|nr:MULTISPECIES: hypothetical protein [unclassified Corallococcus]MBZ4330043.1 hypothetical protein [Corallococcus sp. AS-1-12]MBZ4371614.1 hypothetical protein [Corallococcus sp. AS-1-6]
MSILYAVPPIGNSTNAQKGPTCWYYAAKMVARCHEPWPPPGQKWISLIRKISTFIAANNQNLNNLGDQDLLLAHKNFMGSSMNKDKVQVNPALSQTGFKALEPTYKWDLLPDSLFNPTNAKLVPTPSFIRQQDLPLPSGIKGSLSQLEGRQFDGLDEVLQVLTGQHDEKDIRFYRSQIESSFVATKKHSTQEVEASLQQFMEWKKQGFARGYLLTMLGFKGLDKLTTMSILGSTSKLDVFMKEHGPLWCGSPLSMGAIDSTTVHNYTGSVGFAAYKCPLVSTTGAATHAIALCGVSVKKDCIYYRDPNFSSHVFFTDFNAFASAFGSVLKDPNVGLMYYVKNANGGTQCQKLEN